MTKRMRTWKFWKHELKSMIYTFAATFLTFFLVEFMPQLTDLWAGNLSKDLFVGLFASVNRSVIRTILVLIFPSKFKHHVLNPHEEDKSTYSVPIK